MRPRGTGRLFQRGNIWWIQFHRKGKPYRESSHSDDRKQAEKLLKTRLYEIANDKFKRKQRTTVEDLIRAAVDEAETLKRHSISSTRGRAYNHIVPAIGERLASELKMADIRSYIGLRRKQKAADSTINRELSLLRRAFRLGMQERLCDSMPHIQRLDESGNVRQGYLEHSDYLKLRAELPKGMDLLLVIGYHFGCRLGELRKLKWSMVDMRAGEIRIPGVQTKPKEARTLPFYGDVAPILEAAKAEHDEWWPDREWIFLRRGKRIGAHLEGWDDACQRAGVPGLKFHDLRRSAVRNMERAGMPRSLAMRISGHRTESMYRRYAIASESDKSVTKQRMESYFDGLGTKLGTEPEKRERPN